MLETFIEPLYLYGLSTVVCRKMNGDRLKAV